MGNTNWDAFINLADQLTKVKRTFITGAGRSGLVAKSFGMRLMHADLPVFIPGETVTPAAERGDLLVAISCTGKTGYTNYLASRAKSLGARVIAITADKNSPLGKIAFINLLIPVKEDNIVLKAAVFEHTASLCLDALFNVISKRLRIDAEAFRKRHANLE
jgi:6-phospho-3-hexuloisomerase